MEFLDKVSNLFRKEIVPDLSQASGGITPELVKEYNNSRPKGPQKVACYAPFKSIYFGHHGRLSVCCYTRQYTLGTYPEQSIKDIWFGENANKLRDALTKYDFSNGCDGCLMQLAASNFDATKAQQYDLQKLNRNKYPSVMEFELENLCNLECIMCNGDFSSLIRANREKREPLDIPYDAAFIEQLKEFIPHLEEVKFYGGEPFLIEIYYKIWELIMEVNPNVRISVQTNATILNNRVKNILNKTNFHINISLDSLNKETYESIRINGKFERVIENIKWFIDYCHEKETFIGISACAMRNNWEELPEMVKFCNEKSVQVYFHTVFYPLELSIRDLELENLNLIRKTYNEIISDLPEISSLEKKNKKHLGDVINQINDWARIKETKANLNSFEAIKSFIENKLSEPYFLRKFSSERADSIIKKMGFIHERLPDNYSYTGHISKVDLSNDFLVEDYIISLEKKDLENL